jgi:hypothetical protein
VTQGENPTSDPQATDAGAIGPAEATPPAGALAGASGDAPATAEPSRPVRVAWVAGPRTLKNIGRILQPLAIGLLDELVELTAICPQAADVQRFPSPPMRILCYGRLEWWAFWEAGPRVLALARELGRAGVQLVHALDSSAAPLAVRLARLAGIPYVLSSYSVNDAKALSGPGSRAAAVLAASEPVAEALRRRRVTPAQHLAVLRPGAYLARHAECFTQPQFSTTIVAGGPLDNVAAFAAVLRSFAALRQRKSDCAFFIMGRGRAERELRRLADDLGLRGEVTFVDWQTQLQLDEILKAADVYISPAARPEVDAWCLLALAAGLPVLSAGAGACDFLIDGRTAAFFRPGDDADLTGKIARFLEDRAAARALAESALEYLRQHHTLGRMVGDTARTYRAVAVGTALPTA